MFNSLKRKPKQTNKPHQEWLGQEWKTKLERNIAPLYESIVPFDLEYDMWLGHRFSKKSLLVISIKQSN